MTKDEVILFLKTQLSINMQIPIHNINVLYHIYDSDEYKIKHTFNISINVVDFNKNNDTKYLPLLNLTNINYTVFNNFNRDNKTLKLKYLSKQNLLCIFDYWYNSNLSNMFKCIDSLESLILKYKIEQLEVI